MQFLLYITVTLLLKEADTSNRSILLEERQIAIELVSTLSGHEARMFLL